MYEIFYNLKTEDGPEFVKIACTKLPDRSTLIAQLIDGKLFHFAILFELKNKTKLKELIIKLGMEWKNQRRVSQFFTQQVKQLADVDTWNWIESNYLEDENTISKPTPPPKKKYKLEEEKEAPKRIQKSLIPKLQIVSKSGKILNHFVADAYSNPNAFLKQVKMQQPKMKPQNYMPIPQTPCFVPATPLN